MFTNLYFLTARPRNPHRPCPITANSTAPQLVKNGTYRTKNMDSDRLVNKEVSELWRISTPKDKCISCLPATKTRESPRSWLHMPGARLERWQCLKVLAIQISIFLPPISQAPKNLEESSSSCHPKTEEARRRPKEL